MRAVGDEDLGPLLPLVAEVRRRHQQGRQLAVGARRRLQADRVQAGDLGQQPLDLDGGFAKHPLERRLVLIRVLGRQIPGRNDASRSFRFGLYFIVHDPSG